jgi:hypothetical protein
MLAISPRSSGQKYIPRDRLQYNCEQNAAIADICELNAAIADICELNAAIADICELNVAIAPVGAKIIGFSVSFQTNHIQKNWYTRYCYC